MFVEMQHKNPDRTSSWVSAQLKYKKTLRCIWSKEFIFKEQQNQVVFGGLRRTKRRLWTRRVFLRFPSRSWLSARIPSVLVSSAAEQTRDSRGWKYLHSGPFLPLKNIRAFADLFAPDGTWVTGRLNKHTAEARLSARSVCLQPSPLRTAPSSFTIIRSASTLFCSRVVFIKSFLCFLFSPLIPHFLLVLISYTASFTWTHSASSQQPSSPFKRFCLVVAAFQNRVKPSGLDLVLFWLRLFSRQVCVLPVRLQHRREDRRVFSSSSFCLFKASGLVDDCRSNFCYICCKFQPVIQNALTDVHLQSIQTLYLTRSVAVGYWCRTE